MTLSQQELSQARDWICRVLSPVWADALLEPPPSALWPEIVRLADVWLVAPRLYDRCVGAGFMPTDAEAVLSAVSDYSKVREQAMRNELSTVIGGLNAAGLEPVVFKGGEWLMGHYAPHARRLISDLDIWLPHPAEQDEAVRSLRDMGYCSYSPLESHDRLKSHHFPGFHKDGAVARIELHHMLIRPSLSMAMDLSGAENRLEYNERRGLRYRRLAHEDALTVAFLQSGRMAAPGFETRKVALSKWLDFLDRYEPIGWQPIASARELGITDGVQPVDVQLLTALQQKLGFSYEGPKDISYVSDWARVQRTGPLVARSLWQSLNWQNVLSLSAWGRFLNGLGKRINEARFLRRL